MEMRRSDVAFRPRRKPFGVSAFAYARLQRLPGAEGAMPRGAGVGRRTATVAPREHEEDVRGGHG